jgi:hypothetical protein
MEKLNPLQMFYAAEIEGLECVELRDVPNLSFAAMDYLNTERKSLIIELLALVNSV